MIIGLIAASINFSGSLNGAGIVIPGGALWFAIVMQGAPVGSLTAP